MSDDFDVEVDSIYEEEGEKLEEEGRQLALQLLKNYKDVKAAATVAGVAATSLMGLIIRITGAREEAIENFIQAFEATIDDETDGWEELPDDEEAGPQPGQSIN
jgi:hypothetical protein